MSVYYHPFEVRWSDLDANFHLANSSYVEYCAQTRMAFMHQKGLSLKELSKIGIGPVILHEKYSFFKEIHHGQSVFVSLEINGVSEDGGIYQFLHKFYLPCGTHCATSEAFGVWIDTSTRRSTIPDARITEILKEFVSENCKILSKEDIKNLPFQPQNIDAGQFQI
ncbi:MAG: thioesterase family protein [Bacteroidetes bacterium]|nr:thioesterase family protein [Bacteroidota bacterium]